MELSSIGAKTASKTKTSFFSKRNFWSSDLPYRDKALVTEIKVRLAVKWFSACTDTFLNHLQKKFEHQLPIKKCSSQT